MRAHAEERPNHIQTVKIGTASDIVIRTLVNVFTGKTAARKPVVTGARSRARRVCASRMRRAHDQLQSALVNVIAVRYAVSLIAAVAGALKHLRRRPVAHKHAGCRNIAAASVCFVVTRDRINTPSRRVTCANVAFVATAGKRAVCIGACCQTIAVIISSETLVDIVTLRPVARVAGITRTRETSGIVVADGMHCARIGIERALVQVRASNPASVVASIARTRVAPNIIKAGRPRMTRRRRTFVDIGTHHTAARVARVARACITANFVGADRIVVTRVKR